MRKRKLNQFFEKKETDDDLLKHILTISYASLDKLLSSTNMNKIHHILDEKEEKIESVFDKNAFHPNDLLLNAHNQEMNQMIQLLLSLYNKPHLESFDVAQKLIDHAFGYPRSPFVKIILQLSKQFHKGCNLYLFVYCTILFQNNISSKNLLPLLQFCIQNHKRSTLGKLAHYYMIIHGFRIESISVSQFISESIQLLDSLESNDDDAFQKYCKSLIHRNIGLLYYHEIKDFQSSLFHFQSSVRINNDCISVAYIGRMIVRQQIEGHPSKGYHMIYDSLTSRRNATALYEVGRFYLKSKKIRVSRQFFRLIVYEYPDSPFARLSYNSVPKRMRCNVFSKKKFISEHKHLILNEKILEQFFSTLCDYSSKFFDYHQRLLKFLTG